MLRLPLNLMYEELSRQNASRIPGREQLEAASICCDSHSSPTHRINRRCMLSLLFKGVMVAQTETAQPKLHPTTLRRVTGLSLEQEKQKRRKHLDGTSSQSAESLVESW